MPPHLEAILGAVRPGQLFAPSYAAALSRLAWLRAKLEDLLQIIVLIVLTPEHGFARSSSLAVDTILAAMNFLVLVRGGSGFGRSGSLAIDMIFIVTNFVVCAYCAAA